SRNLFYASGDQTQTFILHVGSDRLEFGHAAAGARRQLAKTRNLAMQALLARYRGDGAVVMAIHRFQRITELLEALGHHGHLVVKVARTIGKGLRLLVAD